MKRFFLLLVLVSLVAFGCSNKPPACDSSEVKEKVAQTIKELVAQTGAFGECFRPRLTDLAMFSDVSQLEAVMGELDKSCKKGKKEACNVLQCIDKMVNLDTYKLIEVKSDENGRLCAVMEGDVLAFKYKITKTEAGFLYEPVLF